MPEQTLADLSEDDLLARMFPLLPPGPQTLLGPGDDAALLAAPDGRVLVSTDILIEGGHFRRDWSSAADVGWRAAMQNVADIVAMGGRATALVVCLAAPPSLPVRWVLDFAASMAEACEVCGAGVVGGDLSSADGVVVAVTVHGDLAGVAPVLRSGARPGDVLAHAGTLGRSMAGLALLTAGQQDLDPAMVTVYRRPVPPVDAGPAAALAGATAMLDVSDGLLRDGDRLARASDVVLDLDVPEEAFAEHLAALAPAARRLGADPLTWVLTGGEDHGLLATFPAGVALPEPFVRIGQVREAPAGPPAPHGGVLVQGSPPSVTSWGWDHFAGSGA